MKPTLAIAVSSPCASWRRAYPGARKLARDAARVAIDSSIASTGLEMRGPVEIGITLVNDAEQRRLNAGFAGRDAPTNVLAFPAWRAGMKFPPGVPILLGDVVLAFETVAREAVEQGKPLADHLRHLIVHGVLHLVGYDHQTAEEASRMESLETAILAKLGVPDPYEDPAPSPSPVIGLFAHERSPIA
jgi:probable rRNA maturation factor